MTSIRVRVTGRVQGVGYRWFVNDLAAAGGIAGWVRNRHDGSVEAELHGEALKIDGMLDAMSRGPRSARIDDLEVTEIPEHAFDGFEIRPTR
ncbi:acylphosphatase [Microbacterium sp. GXF0217]